VIQKPELGRRSKEWGKYSLQSLCSYIADGKHGDCRNQDNSGFYFLSAKDVSEGRLFYEKARQITKEDFKDTHKRTRLEAFDILLTNSGTIGRMAVAEDNELTSRTTFQKSVAILKPIKQKVFPRFLYYCLVDRKSDIVNAASGTTQQNLLLGDLRSFEVEIPEDIETQRCIADILSALDDKIELNRQTNATLEAITQAIFKEWFVDYSFPGATGEMIESELGMIPRGWMIRSLYDAATYINGAAYRNIAFTPDRSGLPIIKINELKYGITPQTDFTNAILEPKYKINNGEILLSWSGSPDTSLDTFVWSGGPAWLNQHIFRVIPHGVSETHFVYYLLRHLMPILIEIARDKQTTGLGHITVQDMKRTQVLAPSESVMQAFSERVAPLYDRKLNNDLESRTLVALRDTLLPKLMSGEIEV
jgi:type I restriction enzyme S subunit